MMRGVYLGLAFGLVFYSVIAAVVLWVASA